MTVVDKAIIIVARVADKATERGVSMSNIKAKRVENKLNQLDLANLLEIDISTYSRKENGIYRFTISEALTLAKYLNSTVEELFCDIEVA